MIDAFINRIATALSLISTAPAHFPAPARA
jgi:hypothetical protein